MKTQTLKTALVWLLLNIIFLGAIFPSRSNSLQTDASMLQPSTDALGSWLTPAEIISKSTSVPDEMYLLSIPLVLVSDRPPPIELADAWTDDTDGGEKYAFLSDDSVRYLTSGLNNASATMAVDLSWSQTGPCGSTVIYSDTLSLEPGDWQHAYTTDVPDCLGIYTNTVQITYQSQTSTLTTPIVVNAPSTVVVDTRQAFDKCNLPSVELMQTWWDKSPYAVVNIYLGGISFACSLERLDPIWLHSVAQQGWSFIPTWVGPQPPCTGYTHRMSPDTSTSYQEGRAEADAAAITAISLGLMGANVIYYDIEAYYGADNACRNAVNYFLKGWVERLHELGLKAGSYGSPCNSYIREWAEINPPPDNVWIAHWYADEYDPQATVWDTPCLSDDLWVNHQRLKQYAGGHRETWGGSSLTIDSNVLDGEITALQGTPEALVARSASTIQGIIVPQIRDMGLLSPNQGWVLRGDHLLWTNDGGIHWQEITPEREEHADILAATFLDLHLGWLVRRSYQNDREGEPSVLRTIDGGASWQAFPLPLSTSGDALSVGAASLEFVDAQTGWVALKLQTSSSFSLGRLFSTQDGGFTWQERSLPLGEPVRFADAERGWIAGGASGDHLYHTKNGGYTWQPQSLPQLPSLSPGQVFIGLPIFENDQIGILPVTQAFSPNPRLVLYVTSDGGDTWNLTTGTDFDLPFEPAEPLPFSLTDGGRWWVTAPEPNKLYSSPSPGRNATPLSPTGLPRAIVVLEFLTDQIGWALAQDGTCRGNKIPAGQDVTTGLDTLQCELQTSLLKTTDGGHTWGEITPPF